MRHPGRAEGLTRSHARGEGVQIETFNTGSRACRIPSNAGLKFAPSNTATTRHRNGHATLSCSGVVTCSIALSHMRPCGFTDRSNPVLKSAIVHLSANTRVLAVIPLASSLLRRTYHPKEMASLAQRVSVPLGVTSRRPAVAPVALLGALPVRASQVCLKCSRSAAVSMEIGFNAWLTNRSFLHARSPLARAWP
jgi:hypothetical protein